MLIDKLLSFGFCLHPSLLSLLAIRMAAKDCRQAIDVFALLKELSCKQLCKFLVLRLHPSQLVLELLVLFLKKLNAWRWLLRFGG